MSENKVDKKPKTTKSKSTGIKKKKQAKEKNIERDEKGRFVPGKSGNPGGRPKLSEDFEKYAKLAPKKLWEIVEDDNCSLTLKASILEWFDEMYYGKASQQVSLDAEQTINGGSVEVEFKGDLAKWAK